MVDRKIMKNANMTPDTQHAVWRDSGISPAETAVRIWKFVPRRKFSEAATSQSRWHVMGKRGTVEKQKKWLKRIEFCSNPKNPSKNTYFQKLRNLSLRCKILYYSNLLTKI